MTRKVTLKLGRINANEDEAKFVQISIREGQAFYKDDLLLTLETSKSAVDILAPSNGRMITVFASEGQTLQLGDRVFEAEFEGEPSFESLSLQPQVEGANEDKRDGRFGQRKVSFKAEKLARSLGLDIGQIAAAGSVLKESDVSAHFAKHGNAVTGALVERKLAAIHPARCVLIGAGGHAKSLIAMIRQAGYTISGVTDTRLPEGSSFAGLYSVLGTNEDLPQIYSSGTQTAFLGVGGPVGNDARKALFMILKGIGYRLPPLISRDAFFDASSSIGEASYVFPAASVGADCTIGANCIVNQGSIVCHDCEVGDHVHLAPGAILAGSCVIGESTTIGMAATVMNEVTVGRNCLIHNNVALARDVPAGKTFTIGGVLD